MATAAASSTEARRDRSPWHFSLAAAATKEVAGIAMSAFRDRRREHFWRQRCIHCRPKVWDHRTIKVLCGSWWLQLLNSIEASPMLILPSSTATFTDSIAPVVEGSRLENGTCHSASIRAIIMTSSVTGKEAINASVPESVSPSRVVDQPTDRGR